MESFEFDTPLASLSDTADSARAVTPDLLAIDIARTPLAQVAGPPFDVAADAPSTLADVLRRASEAAAPGRVTQVARDGGEVTLDYREVRDRAERVLGGLRALGVAPGCEVVIQAETADAFMPALWACIMGGFTAVPAAAAGSGLAADRRLREVWTTLGRPLVVAGAGLAAPARAVLGAEARVAELADLAAHEPDGAWHPSAPGAVAVLILSSGTTGRPKLIQRTHHNLLRVCQASPALAGFSEITFLNWLPLDHNAGLTATLAILAAGARQVHLGTRDVLEDPARWLSAIDRHRVTHTGGTNYALGVAAARLAEAGGRTWDLSCVESMMVTAEPVVARTVRAFAEQAARHGLRPEVLRASYAMSEVGGITRLASLRLDGDGDAFVGAGAPYPGISLRVVDDRNRVVREGREGRIQVRGETVTPGYAHDEALTAESFTADGWFDTGDAGFLRAGELTITGREKDVLIVNGLNVHSQEVEAAVEEVDGVHRGSTAAVAVRLPGRDTDAAAVFLHTSLAGEEARNALRREVRRVVAGRFGAAVAHVLLVQPADIPRTEVGKVQRAALRRRLRDGAFAQAVADDVDSGGGEGYAAPRTDVERELCAAWAEVLGVERVGIHEDFLGLGGHSLLAMRVVSRVRSVLGVELPLRVMFEAPTVAEMANAVEEIRRATLPPLAPVAPVERTAAPPLSFAQERLWFLDRLEPGSPLFNLPATLRLEGVLDAAALERSLGEIVRRHESLRTTFAEAGGGPVQVIAPFGGFALPVVDLSSLGADERETEVLRRITDEAARPFDLTAGPLFRAALLRLGAEEHVLLLCMHHIVSDEWSMRVFFRELAALYAGYRDGREPPLAELAVQYADHAVWQRRELSGEALERQLAWWKERLAGAPELLALPTDHPRAAVQSHRGAHEPIHIGGELLERLEARARGEGVTLFMVVLGVFQALLSRHAASDDVVVGSTIAGRTRSETEPLIGLFMNMLALRTDLSGDPTFREVLRRVREVTLGAYEHQDAPFEMVVEAVSPARSLGHSPLVQVLFELYQADGPGAGLPGLRASGIRADTGTAKFDLALALSAGPRGLTGGLTYSTDLFERGTARRMVEQLERVLEQIAGDPGVRLSGLDLIGPDERRQVVEAWNRTETAYPADRCIHQLFEEQAEKTPDAIAVVFGGARLTYAELDERANRLANHLRRLGVGPEVRVGLCLERGPEVMVAILGVMKAGGAYVPVDASHPAERIGYVFGDSGAAVVLTQDRLRTSIEAGEGVRVVAIDAAWGEIAAESADAPETGVTAENLAYVIYTSGSTGRPKGVAMHHRGVSNYIDWGVRAYGADAGNGAPVFSSMAVDLTITNLLPLFAGLPVHLLPEENAVEALAETLRSGPDFGLIKITPVHLTLLTPMLTAEEARRAARTLVIGADFLSAEPTVWWQENAPGVRLMNEYGPTETVVGCSAYTLPTGLHQSGPVPVGGPIQNLRFYVLDAHGEPVPVGLPGELYIGGAGVARGYLGRPSLSAEKFVPDPFAGPGARMYRTGDRARWLEGGSLTILGRTDHQVKIRGYRVEPGEIEAVLRRHESVSACLVVVREDVPGDKRLVAYVVGEADARELREHLRRALPEYMVPAAFVTLDALPRTATGKIDPKTLPAPEYGEVAGDSAAPRTPVEEVVAGIWAEVLHVARVGVHDDFFELGGHSLLAIQVVSRIRAAFGVEVPLRALFESPTVAQLAERVEALRRAGLPVLPPVVPVDRSQPLPLSFAQERLWFLDRLQPGSAFYNIPTAVRLSGALDAPALERALGEVVRRHEVLRTVVQEGGDGIPVQVVAPFEGFTLTVDDLSALADAEREAEARRRVADEAVRPFDLAAGPLFRAALLRLEAEEHVLLLSMHHTVSDGWSIGVLFRELRALYAAYVEGRESPLDEPAIQYADFAVWQRRALHGEALEGHLAFWRERLAGAPALLELPADRPRPPMQSFRGALERITLPSALVEGLRALGRGESATLHMVLLGAFQVLLSKYSGSDDVVVGTPVAGRTRHEVEALIGFFVNTLVLRTDLSGDPSFRDVLRRVREVTLGAYEHQEVPFERLVEELQPERSLSHSPLVQVVLSLDRAGRVGSDLAGLRMRNAGAEIHTAKFDLLLDLVEDEQGLRGVLQYSTDLFDRGTAQRMLHHLERLLEQVAADANAPLSRLSLVNDQERRRVMEEWNATDEAYPADACIHTLFEAQVARTPDAVAVIDGVRRVTYRELNARANRLAHHLIALGVGAEARVGIGMERGVEMVAAMLAVLKAGGAYVPLDPAYPADRLAFTLRDSSVEMLVTQETMRARLPVHPGMRVVSIDGDAAGPVAARGTENPRGRAAPRSLAYLIYTSGSTGVPKGVAIEHQSAVVMLSWAAGVYTADDVSGMLAATSICFDISIYEIFLPLSLGGRVIMAENALALGSLPARDEVRLVNTVPSAMAALLKNDAVPAGVKTVNLAGEPLRADLVDAVYALGGVERVYDMYGPSEDTTYSTFALRAPGGPVTIGRPISNTRAYVLDAGLRPVPAGVVGELYLAGLGLGRGYLGRPALTASRFVPDHLGGEPGARLYRTGDRVRWRADGTLECLGRLDAQVKVRGYRIELGEIESVLRLHSAVADCVAVVREDAPGDRRLVAYVVGEADADTLRRHLRRSVPEYMVPSAFVTLDALPLLPNGKVDRKSLPAPVHAQPDDAYVAPRTPVEEALAEIWGEVLHVERVGAHENFFELGGHSLMATRIVSRIRAAFAVELPLRVLFEAPTVAALAARVEAMRGDGPAVLPPVVATQTAAPPLSFAQERLWFLDRLRPGTALFNIPVALRLRGPLDVAALERALGEIVRRHQTLRSVIHEDGGRPVQVVAPAAALTLPVETLATADAEGREAEVKRRVAAEAARPFDLAAGPPLRVSLLRLGEGDHVLLLTLHHAAADGWSLGVLFRELEALYAAFSEGRPSPLAELPVQYADYAAWQREHLRGHLLDRQVAWWKERLAGAPALLELPADHPRPAVQTYRGAFAPLHLPASLAERLRELGRREGATLYMVLLGAFQVLLSKYAGAEDVVVGTTIAGHTRAEVEGLIGLFMNTLVLRTDLSGDPDFGEVLRRVRDVTLGAYEHQDVPFERLVAELRPERTLSHAALFQVLLELHEGEGGGPALPGLEVRPIEVETGTAKVDLALVLSARGGGIDGGAHYSTDLFERGTIVRLLAQLRQVLEQVADHPERRLSRLELMTRVERARVLDWNRTEAAYPAERCIHQLFEAQAARTPDAPAVIFGEARLTYAELDQAANRLAHHLIGLGVGPEVRVGLCLERGMELMPAILGVIKAGGAYVPVDPSHPAERISYVLKDAGVEVLLTQASLLAKAADVDVRVVCVDTDAAEIAAGRADAPRTGVTAENLAYVIYTSGSTGRPKGVAMHHRGVCNYLHWGVRAYGADAGKGAPVFSSMAVDLTITNLLPLFAGLPIHLLPEENAVEALAGVLRTGPDFGLIKITPVHLTLLTPMLTPDEARRAAKTLVIGADFLSAEPTVWWQENAPGVRLMNEYGPTETVVGCSAYVLPRGRHRAGPVPVGHPIQNIRFYVLDAHMEPVPVGLPGELYIGGTGVARGYLGRPSLSAEKFVPDPFAGAGARMYRSGDRARWLADGNLMILGRTDHQVKIRGYRVELGEIEAALRRHPAVSSSLVVVREDVPGDKRLVAYVVGDADAESLRADLRRGLPEYMIPNAFVRLGTLPKTKTGKIDPKSLPAPEVEHAAEDFVAPRTPVEELLAAAWSEVLGIDRVGTGDSFFALGGHSLLAMRIISRVRQTLGVELPLRALFEEPTLGALAERVEALRRADPLRLPPVVPVDRAGPLPLSFAQERLWFLDRMQPGSTVYVVPFALRLSGALDVLALEQALGEVVRRHEVLRTVFRDTGDSPVQVISPFFGFVLPVEDISALAEAERRARTRARLAEEASRAFDLLTGPLFRARLLRLGDAEHVLLLSLHHAVGDGWSAGVLLRELAALYGAYRDGCESPLPALPVQYADYAVWQREQLRGEALEHELAWWRERLAGAPALLELPTDHPRPRVQSFRGAFEEVSLPAAMLDRLQALAQDEGVTLYMLLLAAWQVLLAKYAGSDDVVVGGAAAGRGRGEVEGLIGLFVNTLVLRTDLSGDPGFREVLRRVRETTLGAWEHQDLPFERLVAELRPERSLGHSPLFQATFSLEDAGWVPSALPGVRGEWIGAERRTTKFDLTLDLAVGPDGVRGSIGYASDLFEPATIQRMREHLERVLEQVTAAPARRLSELELMSAAERAVVVDSWGGQDGGYRAAPVHELVSAQCAWTPDAAALSYDGRATTYRELDAASNRLAHHLAARGAGPESIVALVAERSVDTVVAILAVMKAGAAYLPLDPAYPEDRLRYMLADSGARLLVHAGALPDALRGEGLPPVVDLRAEAGEIAARPANAPGVAVDPANLAYVIYTSGSTGRPKGVAVAHHGIPNETWWMRSRLGLRADDRVLQFASFSFDAAVNELFPALLSGATLVMARREALAPGEALRETVRRERVTFATLPPSVLAVMDPAELPSLRVVLSAGEALPMDVAERWARAVELHNAYGPTEATVGATSARVAPGGGVPAIGRPLEHARAYVLDAAGRPVPAGVPGELCLGGAGVARGYLRRPALTAERFVPDPFSPLPGARLYRTGDRARWRADGELEYLGRLDGQVKVRGFRIEPGEIESVLRRHPAVSDCVVIAREDRPGDRRLVAYVVGAADADEVRAHLRLRLPAHMVPGPVVSIDAIPLSPNGKVDRRALPPPAGVEPGSRRRAAETELEARVAAVWAEVLGVDEVGVEDNFFDLGGHSLLLVGLQARLAAEIGADIRVVELFEFPTVRTLAGRLAGGPAQGADGVHEAEQRGGTRQAALDRRLVARRRRGA